MAPVELSPSTFLYSPGPGASKLSPKEEPRVVVLATWAFALDNHIAKYVEKYRELFPSTTILVAKCFLRHFFWLPAARQDLEHLAAAIRGILDTGEHHEVLAPEASRPKVLLHIFSNSGLFTAYQLHDVYQSQDGSKQGFPQHVTIFDSTPGRYEYWSVASALQFGIPPGRWAQKLISIPLAHMLSGSLWIWCRVLNGEDWVTKWARAANDPIREQETCRSYAYSSADPLVEALVVEAHAEAARQQGFCVLQTADFGAKSAHVAHARADPLRYWSIVMDTWKTTSPVRSFDSSDPQQALK